MKTKTIHCTGLCVNCLAIIPFFIGFIMDFWVEFDDQGNWHYGLWKVCYTKVIGPKFPENLHFGLLPKDVPKCQTIRDLPSFLDFSRTSFIVAMAVTGLALLVRLAWLSEENSVKLMLFHLSIETTLSLSILAGIISFHFHLEEYDEKNSVDSSYGLTAFIMFFALGLHGFSTLCMALPHMIRPGKRCWKKCYHTCCRVYHFLEECCTLEENNSSSLSSRTSTTQAVNNPRASRTAEATLTRIRTEANVACRRDMNRTVFNGQYNPTINALLENNRARNPNMRDGTSSRSLNSTRQPDRSAGNIRESTDSRRRSSATSGIVTIDVSPFTSSAHTSIGSPPAYRDTAEANERPDPLDVRQLDRPMSPPPPYANILTPIVAP